jgi:protocatechuate 3,4-dioxygenase beta subunit
MNCMPARTVAFCLLLVTGVFAQQLKTAASFEISGTLVDAATGHPLARAHVAIASVSARGPLRVVVTGEDGAFRFDGVSKGKYTLTAERRGYLTQAFDQHDQYASSIATGPGLESRRLVFRLPPEGKISGKITDEINDPVAAASVTLSQESPPGDPQSMAIWETTLSDDEGNYHFGHLRPGHYFLSVEAQPWYARHIFRHQRVAERKTANAGENKQVSTEEATDEGGPSLDVAFTITYYPGVNDAASAGVIELGAGQRFTADFMLQPVRAVPVRLTLGSPDSKRHYSVNLRQQGIGGEVRGISTTTSEISPGVIEISGVRPGRYTMDVDSWNEDGTRENPDNSEKEIEIDASGAVHAHSEAQNAAMSGTVKFDHEDKEQTFPANAFLYLRNKKTGQVLYGPISDKGEYEVKNGVPPGAYDVGVSNVRDALTSSIMVTGAKVAGQTLQITGRSAVSANLVLTSGIGRVDGTALLEDKPMAGVMIVLVPEDPGHNAGLFRRDQSDSDGTFTLNSVLPGKYTVVAIQDGWKLDYHTPEVLKRFMAQGTPVQVAPNGKYDIKVKVQPANSQ